MTFPPCEAFSRLEPEWKMTNDTQAPAEVERPGPGKAGTLARFAVIGACRGWAATSSHSRLPRGRCRGGRPGGVRGGAETNFPNGKGPNALWQESSFPCCT